MTIHLSLSSLRRRVAAGGALTTAVLLVALGILACSADRARSDDHAVQPRVLLGTTPSGGRYRFSVRSRKRDALCERLAVRYANADTSAHHCQPNRGRGAHGMWELDCRAKDLSVFGTAYAGVRSVVLVGHEGASERARFVRHGSRHAFVLIAAGDQLPGELRALDRRGRVVSHEHFDAADTLCDPEGGVQPLSVSYPF